jgi:cell wall-associated NlpC family hydrolase
MHRHSAPKAHTHRPLHPLSTWIPIALAGSLLLGSIAQTKADGTITLELPPSAASIAERAAERARQAAERIPEAPKTQTQAPRNQVAANSRRTSRTNYASRGQSNPSERVVGRLGQIERATVIYRANSARSGKLSRVPAGTYLAIQGEVGTWYGILMADGSLGYLHKQDVRVLDYQVVSNGAPIQQPTQQAPAYTGDYNDGLPASKTAYFRGDTATLFREAYRYLGIPYHFGGNAVNGIDCSAFVMDVFQTCGYPLPRHSSDQTAYGIAIPKDQLQPGDRLYFGKQATRDISHTGLYLGNGYFIHASSAAHGVAVSHLSQPLYQRMYICARR